MLESLKSFVKDIRDNVDGYISLAVVNISNGTVLMSDSLNANSSKQINSTAPIYSQIYTQALESLGHAYFISKENTVNEISIIADEKLYVITTSPKQTSIIILTTDAKTSNIAVNKTMLSKYRTSIGNAIDNLFNNQ